MATTIRDLLVKLGVDSDDATEGLDQLESSLGNLLDVMVGVVAGAAAVTAAIAAVAVSAASAGDAIDKGATAAATTTTAYQELDFIAGQMGTTIEIVTKAMSKQTAALFQLAEGAGPAGEALEDLGLTYEQLNALSPEEQFLLTADALSKVEDDQERLRLATKLYGDEMAQKLMPLLSAGGDNLEELARQAHELGLIMSEEDVAASVAFTDALDELWSVLGAIKNAIGLALIPTLNSMMGKLKDWWLANQALINQGLDVWLDVLVSGLESLERIFLAVDATVQRVLGGWMPIIVAIAAGVALVTAAFVAFAALSIWPVLVAISTAGAPVIGALAAMAAALVAVGAAAAGLFVIFDDLLVFFQGGDSALGEFLDTFREADGPLGELARNIEKFIELGHALVDVLKVVGGIFVEVFSRVALPQIKILAAALLFLAEGALGVLAWMSANIVRPAIDLMLAGLENLLSFLDSLGPALDEMFATMDAGLELIGGVLGIDLAPGGGAGEAAAGGAGGIIGGSELFAPSAGEASAGAGGTSSQSNTTVQGNTNTIHGVGLSKEEAQAFFRESEEERARSTSAALEGAEV